jgi:hypothetical protein
LKVSREKLKKADCKFGEMKGLRRASAGSRVVKQRPKPGEILVTGAPLNGAGLRQFSMSCERGETPSLK